MFGHTVKDGGNMIYKPYGNTGKMISALGMGCMRFKKEEYQNGNYESCAAIILRARELGINYFDTAPGYCDDKSEIICGEAFRQMKHEKPFYVSTKCSLRNAKNADEARKMIDQSLKRLNVDKINFYNMWSILNLDQYKEYLKKGGIYEGACKARDEGLIDHICFTTHMRGSDIAKVASDGVYEGVTLGYNAVNFAYRQEGVDAAHAAGLGVVTMNPLGGGIIPANPDYFSFLQHGNDSLTVSALKFIISQKAVTAAIPGYSSIEELEEDVKAVENLKEISNTDLKNLIANLSEELNALCTTCAYCDSCPEGIPIPQLLESYNYYILSKGDAGQVKSRLGMHWGVDGKLAAKCIECGQCEALCTQKLPIIERLKEIAAMFSE